MPNTNPSRRPIILAVLLTLGGLAVIAGLAFLMTLNLQVDDLATAEWLRFLGRFHPVMLHLPIGMLALVVLMECGRWFRRSDASTLWPMFFTAASAVVAAGLGYLLWQGHPDDYSGDLLQSHLRWGMIFAGLAVAALVVKSWVDALGKGGWLYFAMLLASGGVMTVASHDGGSITHGKTFLTDEAPQPLKGWLAEEIEATPARPTAPEPVAESLPVNDAALSYAKHIQPIFDAKCVTCHGPDKSKGKLRMDSYELTLEGGKEGEGFAPGDLDSNILFRMELPLDDEEHMPPEGKKQVTPEELAAIRRWIEQGAEDN
ncbi:c-type cytochrome domain-containing protein [Haloferula sargassicola]|uniref:Cytochrome c domain-containing protein n=1 Tax=Haloferula sargassicola TaxID=490096 RepID=A0ABP9ULH7_9BACT